MNGETLGVILAVIFVVIVIALPIWLIYKFFDSRQRNKQIRTYLDKEYNALPSKIENFMPTKTYSDPFKTMLIAIDPEQKMLMVAKQVPEAEWLKVRKKDRTAAPYIYKALSFKDIISAEMFVDGNQVSSKSMAGALVGGAMFGVTGAVVGSNVGKTTYKKNVDSVKLKLMIRDLNDPTFELVFYKKGSFMNQQKAQEDCQQWLDTIKVATSN